MLKRLLLAVGLLLPGSAFAACVGGGGVPFVCDAAVNPVSGDLVLGGQIASSNTVKFSLSQLASVDHSQSPVTVGGVTHTLAVWLAAQGGGGGGGSGTVLTGQINQLAYFAANGTIVSGLPTGNNGVLITSSTGVPGISSTLPAGIAATNMVLTTPTLSSPVLTGTTAVAVLNASGKITTLASASGGAGFNLPHGAAPTSPADGDLWTTGGGGLFARVNGATKGPFVSGATAPLTDTNGVLALGVQPGAAVFNFDSTVSVHNDTYFVADGWPWASGTINSVGFLTGGTSSPSFSIAIQINGVNVTSCNGLSVTSPTLTTTTCTGANTIAAGQPVTLVISGASGLPTSAVIHVAYAHSAS